MLDKMSSSLHHPTQMVSGVYSGLQITATAVQNHMCLIDSVWLIPNVLEQRGHGESEPRSVGIFANAHSMSLLLQRTRTQSHNSTEASLKAPNQGLLVSQ